MIDTELRITITRENVDKIVQLIKELVDLESATADLSIKTEGQSVLTAEATLNYLAPPPALKDLPNGKIITNSAEAEYVGTLGLFNSFFPVKAVLRVLAHMMEKNDEKPVNLQQLVEKSIEVFRSAGLSEYRGFPMRRKGKAEKESAIGRLVWHFIVPARDMGLIDGDGEIPARAWDDVCVALTKEGLEFAKLENRILDKKEREQILSDTERRWMLEHMKKIDGNGYKEYSFLTRIFEELKKGNTSLSAWLERDKQFNEYVKSWSRKAEDPKEFKGQIEHVAAMFAQGKIALLRELGVISNKRGTYQIIHELEE